MKIAIVGPGRAGKDETANYLSAISKLRYTFSTSEVICPFVAAQLGISETEAFATRHEHRDLWLKIGDKLCEQDPAFLARKTLNGGDLCVGVRQHGEMMTVRYAPLVSLVLWIDRDVPPDPTLKFGKEMADVIVPNYWGVPELHARLKRLAASWGVLNDVPPHWRS